METTPRLFRRLVLATVTVWVAQLAIGSIIPDTVPEVLRLADRNLSEEFGKSLTQGLSPGLKALVNFAIVFGALAAMGATAASIVGLYKFKWWGRRLAVIITPLPCLFSPFLGYVLSSGFGWAFSYFEALLWGVILSMAYFSPIANCFARDER